MHGKREQPNGYSQRQTIKNQLIMNANRGSHILDLNQWPLRFISHVALSQTELMRRKKWGSNKRCRRLICNADGRAVLLPFCRPSMLVSWWSGDLGLAVDDARRLTERPKWRLAAVAGQLCPYSEMEVAGGRVCFFIGPCKHSGHSLTYSP